MVLGVALVWPGRVLHAFDGLPLDCVSKAVVLGVTFPMLWLLAPGFLNARWTRLAIVLLLAVKVGGSVLLTQQGLCARFSTTAPVHTRILTIPIDEPDGVLRSWDVRADWRAEAPKCTAVVDRSYETWAAFPVWFVNFTDFIDLPDRVGVRTEDSTRRFTLDISGAVTVADAGLFSIDLGRDMELDGRIDSTNVASAAGAALSVPLGPGVHDVQLRVSMTGDQWTFMPKWNGRSAFQTTTLTVKRPRAADRWLAPAVANSTIGIVALLLLAWTGSVIARVLERAQASHLDRGRQRRAVGHEHRRPGRARGGLAAARRRRGSGRRIRTELARSVNADRGSVAGLLCCSDAPAGRPRVAVLGGRLAGVPGRGLPHLHERILAGRRQQALRLSASLSVDHRRSPSRLRRFERRRGLLGCGVSAGGWARGVHARRCRRRVSMGRRRGRGNARDLHPRPDLVFRRPRTVRIAAAGFAFYVALSIVRADGRLAVAAVAGVLAVLMFYARLNQLIFAVCLAALWLPPDVPAAWRRLSRATAALDPRPVTVYAATFAAGLILFAWRTWFYSGVFSLLYGTSLKNNDTGLRVSTVGSLIVWKRIAHSVSALVWMNEPPALDPRALLVVAGVVLSVLALLQVPRFARLPASVAIVTVGATMSSFVAHTHAYPGRMSIHLVPFAVAVAVVAVRMACGFGPFRAGPAIDGEAPA